MKLDLSELAMKMLRWEEAQMFADQLRSKIEDMVMAIGKTYTVGNVKAVYSSGRKRYDYQTAADGLASNVAIELFTVMPAPRTDWRKICDHIGIEKADIPFTQSEPSVKVKLLAAE